MTTPRIDPLTPRGQVRADALRQMGRETERAARLTVNDQLNMVRTSAGPVVIDPRPPEILLRVIDCDTDTGAYSWQQVYADYDPDTNTVTYVDHDGGLSGTTTDLPAFEVNGNEIIPAGRRAFAVLSDDRRCYLIEYCCDTQQASGGELIITGCCPEGLPVDLVATFTETSGCACIDGETITITHDGTRWTGQKTICSTTVTVTVACVGTVMHLTVTLGADSFHTAIEFGGGDACDPLSLGITIGPTTVSACGGTAEFVVEISL